MSGANKSITVEDGTEEPDALAKFNELFGDLYETGKEPTQVNGVDQCPEFEGEIDPYSYNPFDRTQLPQTEGEVQSVVEDLTQKLRQGGLARRIRLNRSLKEHPECWKALRRPASMHASQLSLAQMLTCVPQVDRERIWGWKRQHSSLHHGKVHVAFASYSRLHARRSH
jgi:hypothetical protein